MILISLVLALSGIQSTREAWVNTILSSPAAQQVVKTQRIQPFPTAPDRMQVLGNAGTPTLEMAASAPIYGAIDKAALVVHDDLLLGQEDAAYGYLESLRQQHPDYTMGILGLCIKCELLTGHYDEAFRDVVNQLHVGWTGGEEMFLYLSLASAGRGQIVDGQAQYCQSWISSCDKTATAGSRVTNLEQGQSPKQVMLLSAKALGTKSEPEFLELALRLDPTDELAAREAIQNYKNAGRYSEVRRIASLMADHLQPCDSRNYYLAVESSVANLKDKPLRLTINP